MFKLPTVVLLCFLLSVYAVENGPYLKEKPDYLTQCARKDPSYVECTTKNIRNLIDVFLKGNGFPGLYKTRSLDPLLVPKIEAFQDGNDAVNVNINMTNVVIRGLNNMKILESKEMAKDTSARMKIFLAKLEIENDYALQGKILLVNLNDHGKMTMEATDINIEVYTLVRTYQKDQFHFYDITATNIDYTLGGFKIHLENLFNGNKELGDSTNALFNENWQALHESIKPIIKKTISGMLLNVFRAVFRYIPVEYIHD